MKNVQVFPGFSAEALRAANVSRLPEFKNGRGGPAHARLDGSDWTPLEWCGACLGELGELANLLKKLRRGDVTLDEIRGAVADEIADVLIYLDLLAFQVGVDTTRATIDKFNRTSERVGSGIRLSRDGEEWSDEAPR